MSETAVFRCSIFDNVYVTPIIHTRAIVQCLLICVCVWAPFDVGNSVNRHHEEFQEFFFVFLCHLFFWCWTNKSAWFILFGKNWRNSYTYSAQRMSFRCQQQYQCSFCGFSHGIQVVYCSIWLQKSTYLAFAQKSVRWPRITMPIQCVIWPRYE